ncbi:MAG: amidohydrolase family protein, partial [Sphingobium sp.]
MTGQGSGTRFAPTEREARRTAERPRADQGRGNPIDENAPVMPRLIRNVHVDGQLVDIAIDQGVIAAIGPDLCGELLLDANGGTALPGLHDHHIHLLATAAERQSVRLDHCIDAEGVYNALRNAPPGHWLRATGYHERMAGMLDRQALDAIVPNRPLRVQHQTGGLWMLNSAALAALTTEDWPEGAERDAQGKSTGRFFRCDDWLSAQIGRSPPDLGALGRELAAVGITGCTDASINTDASSAALLANAVRDGRLPLRLTLMSGGPLEPAHDGAYAVGPVKILLDDDRLPPLEDVIARIALARSWGRTVAAHCVTGGELAVMLAAFQEAGARPGDRIEHGGIIAADAVAVLRELGLTVVTQSGFIATRGDRYRILVDPAEQDDLYRCATLLAAAVPVGGSSDAPYGDIDPWQAIRTATDRRTARGHVIGAAERIGAMRALDLYLSPADAPGGPPRRLAPGCPADIC